jgi:hypothetical protein
MTSRVINGKRLRELKSGYYVRLWVEYPAGLYSGPGFQTVARIIKVNGDCENGHTSGYENQMSGVYTSKGFGRSAMLVATKKSGLSQKDLADYNDGRKATDFRRVPLKDGGTSHWEKTWEHNFNLW